VRPQEVSAARVSPEPIRPPGADAAIGLCLHCLHATRIVSARGSVFWLCRLAAEDPSFARYPRLPVLRCAGHRSSDADS